MMSHNSTRDRTFVMVLRLEVLNENIDMMKKKHLYLKKDFWMKITPQFSFNHLGRNN